MNLGIYIQNLNNKQQLEIADNLIRFSISNGIADDGCIFYDNIGPVDGSIKCAMFNSTDIWNFSGQLVVFSLDCARYALKIINKFHIYYLYGLENVNILNLLDLLNKDVRIICPNKEFKKELYRTTGTFPIGTSNQSKNITKFILGDK